MTTLQIVDNRMDVTDPCYDRDTWCAIWDLKVKNGDYLVDAVRNDEGRVKEIRAFITDEKIVRTKHIGDVGVDAGLCGFFSHKPDFDNKGWADLCHQMFDDDCTIKMNDLYCIPEGFFSSSGYGDGCYPVTAYYNSDDEIVGLTITFIGDDDEDDYEDEE